MRLRTAALAALMLGAGLIGTPARAAEPTDRTCHNELILGGTFHNVTVPPGAWCLFGDAVVSGDFRATRAASVGIFFTARIKGNVIISGTTSNPDAAGEIFGGSANAICTSTIDGNLTIQSSEADAPWNIGSTNYPPYANFSNCVGPNTIGGQVRFDENASTINAIGGNTIGSDLDCTGNGGFTPGFLAPAVPNKVQGQSGGQCASLGRNPQLAQPPTAGTSGLCRSKRRFTIRLDPRLISATVILRSRPPRKARVLRGHPLRAVIDLRGLPRQRILAVISGHDRRNRQLHSKRTYSTCM